MKIHTRKIHILFWTLVLFSCILINSIILRPAIGADGGWWNYHWNYRKRIDFDNTAISENLQNFPMPIIFDNSQSGFWSHVKNDGSDIRFLDDDGTTELFFELEAFNSTNDDMVAWVKIPQIDSGSGTDHIWIYYGNTAASFNSYCDSSQVWDSNYVAVWHLNQTGTLDDATLNNNDGSRKSSGEPQYTSSGYLDGAQEWDGNDDYIQVSDSSSLDISSGTFEAWVYLNSNNSDWVSNIIAKTSFDTGNEDTGYGFSIAGDKDTSYTGKIRLWVSQDTPPSGLNGYSNTPIGLDGWKYCVATFDSGVIKFYLDGVNDGTVGNQQSSLKASTEDLAIGGDNRDWLDYVPDGKLDEIRISNTNRSDEWIEACFQYASDPLKLTIGTEETVPPDSGLVLDPTSVTTRKYSEDFAIQINVYGYNLTDFEFEIHYNTTLMDFTGISWDAWGSGTVTISETEGNITGYTSGTQITKNTTLMTLDFHHTYYHIWKNCLDWQNNLAGTIYIQRANLSFQSTPNLVYIKDGIAEFRVTPYEVTYTFAPIRGDLNNDGTVDIYDLRAMSTFYQIDSLDPEWTAAEKYDLNCDDIIDIFDLVIAAGNFGYMYNG